MAWETKRSCIRPVRVDGETMPGFYNFYILPHACYFRPGGVYTVHVQKTSNHRQRQHVRFLHHTVSMATWREHTASKQQLFFHVHANATIGCKGPGPHVKSAHTHLQQRFAVRRDFRRARPWKRWIEMHGCGVRRWRRSRRTCALPPPTAFTVSWVLQISGVCK